MNVELGGLQEVVGGDERKRDGREGGAGRVVEKGLHYKFLRLAYMRKGTDTILFYMVSVNFISNCKEYTN